MGPRTVGDGPAGRPTGDRVSEGVLTAQLYQYPGGRDGEGDEDDPLCGELGRLTAELPA